MGPKPSARRKRPAAPAQRENSSAACAESGSTAPAPCSSGSGPARSGRSGPSRAGTPPPSLAPLTVRPAVSVEQPLPSPTPPPTQTASEPTATARPPPATIKAFLNDVLLKLNSGLYRTIKKSSSGKRAPSKAWHSFNLVVNEAGLEVGAVQCTNCLTLLTYKASNGPSHLVKHTDSYCPGTALNRTSDEPYRPTDTLPASVKSTLIEKLAEVCGEEMCTPEVVTCPAMVRVIQAALDIGRAYGASGKINAAELMPHRTTVTRHLKDMAKDKRKELVERVKHAIKEKRCHATTDMWTDEHKNNHHICVTVHFANDEYETENHDLLTAQFPYSKKTNASSVRAVLVCEMEKIGISKAEFEGIQWTTDQGANVKKALEDLPREDCMAHVTNTTLRNTFNVSHQELRKKAMAACQRAQEIGRDYAEAVRQVKKVDKGQYSFDLKRLRDSLKHAQPARASYVQAMQSVNTHRQKVSQVRHNF